MSEMDKATQALMQMIRALQPKQSIIAKVISVDESNYTCVVQPLGTTAPFNDVRLKPSIDSNDYGIIAVPEVNSFVIVAIIGALIALVGVVALGSLVGSF